MTAHLSQDGSSGCPSELALDRLFAGECNDLEKARILRQLASCAACAEALEARRAEREDFAPDPQLLARLAALDAQPTAAPSLAPRGTPRGAARRWRHLAPAAVALASCAALLVLALRPRSSDPAIDRSATSKGGPRVELLLLRRGELSPVADGDTLYPGDQLQVVLRVAAPRFVALYSRDGAGTLSRYAPTDPTMTQVLPGGAAIMPNSTVLDEVLGRETLAVFLCELPQEDARLRAHVEAGQPAGCEVHRLHVDKVLP